MASVCASVGDVRPVGSRKRRQHQIWRDECLSDRVTETGRGYAAGRCYTRACELRARDERGGIVQEDVWTMTLTGRRLVEMLCR